MKKYIQRFIMCFIGVALMGGLTGSSDPGCQATPPTSAQMEMAQNESTQQRMIKNVPAPVLKTSLERKNITKRLERINQEDMISYIYLVSYGKVMAYHTVRGKVSSLNSYLTAMERIEKVPLPGGGYELVVLEAPDLDGTYGENPNGIFFFTTEGAYVEWKGEYLWSDQPLKLNQPPELVQIISDKK